MPFDADPERVAARWVKALPLFLSRVHQVDGAPITAEADKERFRNPQRRHGMQIIGSSDHEAPLNTGLMLLRPSRTLYREGLRVLRDCWCVGACTTWHVDAQPVPRHA